MIYHYGTEVSDVILFGENIVNYFIKNTFPGDFFLLNCDENIFKICSKNIDSSKLKAKLNQIQFIYTINATKDEKFYFATAIATYQVYLYSQIRSFEEVNKESKNQKFGLKLRSEYGLDTNEFYSQEKDYQRDLWAYIAREFSNINNHPLYLIYHNEKGQYLACAKGELFFLNNNFQINFFPIHKRFKNDNYTIEELTHYFRSHRFPMGLKKNFVERFVNYNTPYTFNYSKLNSLLNIAVFIFLNNRDIELLKRQEKYYEYLPNDDAYLENDTIVTLQEVYQNFRVVFWQVQSDSSLISVPLNEESTENFLLQMMNETGFLYFLKEEGYWKYTDIYSKSSFDTSFILLCTEEFALEINSYTCKRKVPYLSFYILLFEDLSDFEIKKLNTSLLGKLYKEKRLFGGIRIGNEWLLECPPVIDKNTCKSIPSFNEPNYYIVEFDDGFKTGVSICDNKPDDVTNEVLNDLSIGWEINSQSYKGCFEGFSTRYMNGFDCSINTDEIACVSEKGVISLDELNDERSYANHLAKLKYGCIGTKSTTYKLIRKGQYGR